MRSKHSPPPLPPIPLLEGHSVPRLQGSVIVASLAVSLSLIVCVFAWIVVHPHKPHSQPPVVSEAEPPPPAPSSTEPSASLPLPPPAPVIGVTLTKHQLEKKEVLVNHLPLIEETPPSLPPPALIQEKREEKPSEARPAGEKYGTEVLFLNNPTLAGDKARGEKKLLFVMHISGNFEDACFT